MTRALLKEKEDRYGNLEADLKSERQNWEFHAKNLKEEKKQMEEQLISKYSLIHDDLREANYNLRLEKDHQMQHYEEQIHILKENFRRELEKVRKEQGDITLASHQKYEKLEAVSVTAK